MTIFLTLIFILLLGHYVSFLLKILFGLNKLEGAIPGREETEFFSVIIPFRNEEAFIQKSIESMENLDYPEEKYEVIYIDDNSTDSTFSIAETKISKANFKLLRLPDESPLKANKKNAIQFGIENSRGEIVVTTDTDCLHNQNWLRSLAASFDTETAFVSAPVELIKENGIFSRVQQTEFRGLILAGAGLIGAEKPVICNGANIAYRKKAFHKAGGFEGNLDLSSGDDEFLMRKISRLPDCRVKFCSSRDALVMTESKGSISSFFNQRKRWASKIIHYEDKKLLFQLILIFLFYLSLALQVLLAFAGNQIFILTLLLSLITKMLLELTVIKKGEVLFFRKEKFQIFLITELLHIPYIIITALSGIFGNFTWKGRKIKK